MTKYFTLGGFVFITTVSIDEPTQKEVLKHVQAKKQNNGTFATKVNDLIVEGVFNKK